MIGTQIIGAPIVVGFEHFFGHIDYGKAGTGKWKQTRKVETDMKDGKSSYEIQGLAIASRF